jgi:hypothetical protein
MLEREWGIGRNIVSLRVEIPPNQSEYFVAFRRGKHTASTFILAVKFSMISSISSSSLSLSFNA